MENNKFLRDRQTSINICQNKYHTIPIRTDLPKIPKYYKQEPLQNLPPNDFWIKKLDPSYTYQEHSSSSRQNSSASITTQRYEIQYNIINGSYTSNCISHPILTAFIHAYNSHEDIILSPDDIWLMICIYFSKYVNDNTTKLSHLYINDQNNKILTIEDEQSNWESFLQQIHLQMTSHLKHDICSLLRNNFSTTTKVESLLSSLTIMSTFKKCFNYTYSRNSCGIRNVHFMGTLDDWILLREKATQLQLFTSENDDFFGYIDGILPILDQFIQTYKGNVSNQFWDAIFDLNHTKDESSQFDGMYMNGWFLQLCYGNHTKQRCFMTYIELDSLIVPVQVENEHTNTLKTSYLVGGFHGVLSHDEKHKPILSLVIMDDITSITKLEQSIDE